MIRYVVVPMISVQLLLVVLVYFTIVRKRISAQYAWYFCFLVTVILFLAGRPAQLYVSQEAADYILYARVSLLFTLGMPSMLIASAIYTGIRKSKALFILPYLIGFCMSVGYVLGMDLARNNFLLLSSAWKNFLPFSITVDAVHDLQLLSICTLLVVPCSYFLIRALINFKNVKDLVFLFASLLFGMLFATGTYWGEYSYIYYFGSIVPAFCWAWVVFKDVNEMKGKVGSLKDELYQVVQSGSSAAGQEVDKLLGQIEHLSSNNLTVYKLRLREILSRLTDNTIEAGGDSEQLLIKYDQQNKAIDIEEDANKLRELTHSQAMEFSQIIAAIPNQRIERIKQYLCEHYQEDIDIEQLATTFNISRSYLMREFKKETQQTVNQFLTARRIEMAKELLKTHSVTDTAFAVGFNNSNYFSTVFKKTTGSTPIQFQQSLS
ncbi:AraC family transcriptional regulator [Paraglaciecola aquimarina]|uniref:AraC family transcriptional regulator n=1 Tax=Paraglaciecola aquimarina TaxID=1235557 RepID=A0ABU3SUP4_9ALTE|nr:AraC family transcriptional regulator [Paraglaciecola aquimarina]MDU0353719.1 AraC family transcriptional regulator [Paraglaciecola aquimarina]